MKLADKTVLVTGGSKGIGRAICNAFSQQGAKVIFTYAHDKAAADSVCLEISERGGVVHAICVDHTAENCAREIYKLATAHSPEISILVNNVGIFHRASFLEITDEQYDDVLYANLKVPFFLCQLVARTMVEQKIRGSIINVSSLSALLSRSCMTHYQCSKAALTTLSRSLALELGEYGIRVNTVSPGLTATDANKAQWEGNGMAWQGRSAGIPLRRTGIPDDHAGAVVFLASEEAQWITGADLVIDGGMSVY
ncbi:SDR family NAD(P)-dependent oxidoreductase [Pseudomonas fluorescens]|uniref:SDR family oxidoreductase n=1 Tax=Pseudomonas fluorescens TaxID=294 RepID=A0A423LW31_PSEFL|nr:SDR family NAD(P)-dependent oxidoreductase [Pseudomonas fluorescens]RON72526.1 SDR family oxidoreductase [Pseudomonas fluorescens]